MSTRSLIGAVLPSGTIAFIYCHSDGYLEYNGALLRDHYSDPEKIAALLNLGDISILRPEIGEKHNFDWRFGISFRDPNGFGLDWEKIKADPRNNWTRAYGRDRGEKDCETKAADTRSAYCGVDMGAEYWYLWNGKQWLYRTEAKPRFRPLPKRIDHCYE